MPGTKVFQENIIRLDYLVSLLHGPVLMHTGLLLVLLVVDRGKHGFRDRSAVTQLYTLRAVVFCPGFQEISD